MDIYIPLHASCQSLRQNKNDAYIIALSDLPKNIDIDETYLYLEQNEKIDFGLSVGKGGGKILANIAFHHAKNIGDDGNEQTKAEDYTARGKMIAESLNFQSAEEYIIAWLNEDQKQAQKYRDIDAILSLNILEKCPKWIRHNLFAILESESMKQVFASKFITQEKIEPIRIPSDLSSDIRKSANNEINPIISKIMSETMQKPPKYSSSAQEFTNEANKRMKLFQSL